MDTTISGSSTESKQHDGLHPVHLTTELFNKRKKLLKEVMNEKNFKSFSTNKTN